MNMMNKDVFNYNDTILTGESIHDGNSKSKNNGNLDNRVSKQIP